MKKFLMSVFRITAAVVVGFTGVLAVTWLPLPWSVDHGNVIAQPGVSDSQVFRSPEEERTIQIYRTTNQAVVFISTITLTVDPFDMFSEIQPKQGSGSGLIVDAEQGIVLTNLHVIQDANQIAILHSNGQSYRAKLLGYDNGYDIAVLQMQQAPKGLVSLPFGDSAKLDVGQRVLAIGNPFGLERTLATGSVSSLDRTVKSPSGTLMKGLIQVDAAINPGNSGGPLLDMNGRLIGINTAIVSQSGDSAGIGFAVPINQIKRVLPELIATGKVLRPELGWVLVDTTHGVMVRRVIPEGPADQAGVQPIERKVENVFVRGYIRDFDRADLIAKINGQAVINKDQAEEIVSHADPKQPLLLTVRSGGKDGQEREVKVRPLLK